jgi:hypothetical protein
MMNTRKTGVVAAVAAVLLCAVACSSSNDPNQTSVTSSTRVQDLPCGGGCSPSGDYCIPNICTLISPPSTYACVPTPLSIGAACDEPGSCVTSGTCQLNEAGHEWCQPTHWSGCSPDPNDPDAACACFPSSSSDPGWVPDCCDIADPGPPCTTSTTTYNGHCKVVNH